MGQIEGAYVQGQGLFTIEETFWSQQGRMLTKGPGRLSKPAVSVVRETNPEGWQAHTRFLDLLTSLRPLMCPNLEMQTGQT